jgi:hypothetical protein
VLHVFTFEKQMAAILVESVANWAPLIKLNSLPLDIHA